MEWWDWSDFFAIFLAASLGRWFGVWRYKRQREKYKFDCPECREAGTSFEVSSSNSGAVVNSMAADHLRLKHG